MMSTMQQERRVEADGSITLTFTAGCPHAGTIGLQMAGSSEQMANDAFRFVAAEEFRRKLECGCAVRVQGFGGEDDGAANE